MSQQTEQATADANTVRQRRIKEIFEARERVTRAISKATEKRLESGLDASKRDLYIYRAVLLYLREIEPLIRPQRAPAEREDDGRLIGVETDHDWWFSVPVGQFGLPDPGDKIYQITSLHEFTTLDPPLRRSWTEMRDTDEKGEQKETEVRWVHVPWRVSFDAARIVDRALTDLNLDLSVGDSDPATGLADDVTEIEFDEQAIMEELPE